MLARIVLCAQELSIQCAMLGAHRSAGVFVTPHSHPHSVQTLCAAHGGELRGGTVGARGFVCTVHRASTIRAQME